MKVDIIGPNLAIKGPTYHVHELGCQDIVAKRAYKRADHWVIEVASKSEAAQELYPPNEFMYDPEEPDELSAYLEDMKFFPCTSELA